MAATNLNQYYSSQGKPLPSVGERSGVYQSYGLGPANTYTGSAQQNTMLLGKLQAGSPAPAQAAAPQAPAQAAAPQAPAQAAPTYASKEAVTTDLNAFQSQWLNSSVPGAGGSFDAGELAQALMAKGYNATDAANAAKGPDAARFAKEYGVMKGGVRSSEEIRAELQKQLPQGPSPQAPKMEQYYTDARQQYGLEGLEQKINELTAQEQAVEASRRQRVGNEMNKPVAMNVIDGRVSEVDRQERENLDFIQRQKNYAITQYNSALNNIKFIMDLKQTDFNNASQVYNQEYTRAITMIEMVQGAQAQDRSEKDKQVDNARANLQVLINTAKEGNFNFASLAPDQQMNINKMEIMAGLPVGFTSQVQAAKDPKADIVFTNSQKGQVQVGIRQPDGSIKMQTYGTRDAGSGDGDAKRSGYNFSKSDVGKAVKELQTVDKEGQGRRADKGDNYMSYGEAMSAFERLVTITGDRTKAQALLDEAWDQGDFKKWGNDWPQ